MPVTVAKTAGFCFGVQRAVDTVYQQLKESRLAGFPKLYTLGEIIHNPQVVEELRSLGAVAVDSLEQLLTLEAQANPPVPVIIRSHGVPRSVYTALEQNSIPYIDATCPYVKLIQERVQNQPADSLVLIAGDAAHPEVQGIIGHCNATYVTFKSAQELQNLTESRPFLAKMNSIMVAQTTFNTSEWQKCVKTAKKLYTNLKIFDTICKATLMRQTEAAQLAEVDRRQAQLQYREISGYLQPVLQNHLGRNGKGTFERSGGRGLPDWRGQSNWCYCRCFDTGSYN